jgi:type I restriction enzyme S subunit
MEGRQPEGMSKEVADLFCDSFVDSELGMIPKGWRVAKLFEIGKIITGKTPSTKIPEYFGGDIPFITPSDMDSRKIIRKTTRYLTKTGVNAVKSAQIPAESVLVSCIGSDMGKVTCAASNSVTNQQINSLIVDKTYSKEYVYYDLSGRKYELINLASGGSAIPILNKNHFSMINILLPLEKLMQAFEQNAHLISIKIDESDKQAETLTNIRDSLLPKLISGQIRIKEAETIIEKEI